MVHCAIEHDVKAPVGQAAGWCQDVVAHKGEAGVDCRVLPRGVSARHLELCVSHIGAEHFEAELCQADRLQTQLRSNVEDTCAGAHAEAVEPARVIGIDRVTLPGSRRPRGSSRSPLPIFVGPLENLPSRVDLRGVVARRKRGSCRSLGGPVLLQQSLLDVQQELQLRRGCPIRLFDGLGSLHPIYSVVWHVLLEPSPDGWIVLHALPQLRIIGDHEVERDGPAAHALHDVHQQRISSDTKSCWSRPVATAIDIADTTRTAAKRGRAADGVGMWGAQGAPERGRVVGRGWLAVGGCAGTDVTCGPLMPEVAQTRGPPPRVERGSCDQASPASQQASLSGWHPVLDDVISR
eukprot:7385529-Prymnesium_polylepis.1